MPSGRCMQAKVGPLEDDKYQVTANSLYEYQFLIDHSVIESTGV